MGERENRRWAVRQHHVVDERFEIDLIPGEIAHVAFERVSQGALRHALAAPIQRGDGKTACAQIAHGLEIFFDELGAALKQADRSPAAGRRRPARKAKREPVAGLQGSRNATVGYRVGRNGYEVHSGGERSGMQAPYSRAERPLNAPPTWFRPPNPPRVQAEN